MNTGRSKKFGFVTFQDPEDAQKAVESGPHFVDGKEVTIYQSLGKLAT